MISAYGTSGTFLTDNGGEFLNSDFIDMCESVNINVETTAAESPWSNGLVERHNQIIGAMLDKVLSENEDMDFDIALAWCVNAKNSLENCHGFSPYQLALGKNPSLPGFLHDKPPALSPSIVSDIIKQNLTALASARTAFTQNESSERLKRASSHNTRTYSNLVILSGDRVYYKRNGQKKWKGPAIVLGKDRQQVLIKHGGFYVVRVHPCRIMHARDEPSHHHRDEKQLSPITKPIIQDMYLITL